MKSLRKKILAMASVVAVSGLMMASVAGAADKLIVKGAGGAAGNVVRVDDTGLTEARGAWTLSDATQNVKPVLGVYNNDVLRMNVRPLGITEWYLNSGSGEMGAIKYSTPGGGVGIGLFTGATYDQNRIDVANYPTLGPAGTAVFHIGYSGSPVGLTVTKTNSMVGIGTATPTSKLQVVGLPVWADNATAAANGLTAGAFYRTPTGVVMVVY